jgi:exodeoxyribonuclease VII small subunit
MAKEMSFETAMEGLQKCVHELEEGSLTLEETIKRYEEGKKLAQVCRTRLENAKLRITKLKGPDDNPEDGDEGADDVKRSLDSV